jgi:outer membrane protein assembly factor BamB
MRTIAPMTACLCTATSLAQVRNETSVLEPEPASFAFDDWFGDAVAIDGSIAVVGSPQDGTEGFDRGSATIFDARTGARIARLSPSDTTDGERIGTGFAVSGDRVFIGGQSAFPGRPGEVYVYDGAGALIQSFAPDDLSDNDWFGVSIAISPDVLAVAAAGQDSSVSGEGALYLFDPTTYELRSKLQPANPVPLEGFGRVIDLSEEYLVVGRNRSQRVEIYDPSTGALLRTISSNTPEFGSDVAIDGDRLAIVAVDGVHIYDPSTGQELARLDTDPAGVDWEPSNIDLDGRTLLVGAVTDDRNGFNAGAAFLIDVETGVLIANLLPSAPSNNALFGRGAALSNGVAVVGARQQGTRGLAYLFDATADGDPCSPVDLARPFGVIDLADVQVFVAAFLNAEPRADLAGDGIFDLADLQAFIAGVNTGCP